MKTTLSPLQLGSITIDPPIPLAPLAGYSDLAYRTICRRMGAPFCTTEMMLDRCVPIQGRQQLELGATDEDDHPCAAQIVGNDPASMARAAEMLVERGFDAVDLNMACPVNKALRRRRGGWMMQQPEEVIQIVRAVTAAVDVPVTLKVRRKFAEADDEEAFWRMADGARAAGAAALIVHARSVEKKYAGPADWDFLASVKQRFADWTILGSGDVLNPRKALAMLEQTGVDGTLVARGGLGNPWFWRQVEDLLAGREPYRPDLAEQRRVLLAHMDEAVKLYGPDRAPKMMRKFGIRYARMHPMPKAVRMAFVDVRRPTEWHAVVERFYSSDAPGMSSGETHSSGIH
jgi:nifR3 family TIM-barrel protein